LAQYAQFHGTGASGNQILRDENKRHVLAPIVPIWGGRRERVAAIDELAAIQQTTLPKLTIIKQGIKDAY
jgi:hypothetical protein